MGKQEVAPIYVGWATDNHYAQHCAVALFSLCQHHANIPLKLFILTSGLLKRNQEKIRKTLAPFRQTELSFIEVDEQKLWELDGGFQGRKGKANYYRLLFPELLGNTTDKLLYLDVDMVVTNDITPLWNTNIDDFFFAAVENPWHESTKRHEGTGLSPDAPYFNSGMMLLNLRKLRGIDLVQRLVETKSNPHLRLIPGSDMDLLNSIFKNDWLKVDPKWNVIGTHVFLATFFSESEMALADYHFTDSPQAIRGAVTSPAIIHFTGQPKPWDTACTHPYAELYWKFLRQTLWHDAQPIRGRKWVFLREHMVKFLLSSKQFIPLIAKNWLVEKAYRMPDVPQLESQKLGNGVEGLTAARV